MGNRNNTDNVNSPMVAAIVTENRVFRGFLRLSSLVRISVVLSWKVYDDLSTYIRLTIESLRCGLRVYFGFSLGVFFNGVFFVLGFVFG
jgi:hypothetical protein